MEIRFSDNWRHRDNAYPELAVQHAARDAGLHARLKWANDSACRFVLVMHRNSHQLADHAAHAKVIRTLLVIDPQAEIRTAKAIYRGIADFEKQNA
mgnify:CR=1 FL=1